VEDNRPIKVLFVTHNYPRRKGDYSGVFLHLLATKLLDFGIEIHVVAPHDKNTAEYEDMDGVKVYRFKYADAKDETLAYRGNMHRQLVANPFKTFTLLKFLRRATAKASEVIEKENIKLVSVHWVVPNCVIATRLKKRYGDRIKTILHSHGTDARIINNVYPIYLLARKAMLQSESWTVVSTFIQRLILERNVDVADKIRVFPMPNDEEIFYPDESIREEPNLVVAVSRLTKQKRLPHLIEAIKLASAEVHDIKLEIYGSGPERGMLRRFIKERGLEDRISIKNPVPQKDLREIYNRASVAVLNSSGEGFGLILTEAMLCRRAVIGADSGGIVDIIDHEKTGLLVEPESAVDLSGALVGILKDNDLRDRLAQAGYEKALEEFSSFSAAKRFAVLYREFI